MMHSGKLCSRQQKNSKTTHYQSRVQSNTRADFKLTNRELWEAMKNVFGGGRRGGRLIPHLLAGDNSFGATTEGRIEIFFQREQRRRRRKQQTQLQRNHRFARRRIKEAVDKKQRRGYSDYRQVQTTVTAVSLIRDLKIEVCSFYFKRQTAVCG